MFTGPLCYEEYMGKCNTVTDRRVAQTRGVMTGKGQAAMNEGRTTVVVTLPTGLAHRLLADAQRHGDGMSGALLRALKGTQRSVLSPTPRQDGEANS